MIEIKKVVYFAHPLRGKDLAETQANRKAASVLVAKYSDLFRVAPVCAWIHLADEWTEEQGRALGLKINCKLIEAVGLAGGELWVIGPVRDLSEGMQIEVNRAQYLGIPVVDRRGEYPGEPPLT